MTRYPRSVLCAYLLSVAACTHHDFERAFFRQPATSRMERVRALSLEDQYRIFRYGNDVIHPPIMELADPLAERGPAAVPFLLSRLESDMDDVTTRDILLVFERMAQLKTYDVKADHRVVTVLMARVNAMTSRLWEPVCRKMLQTILSAQLARHYSLGLPTST